MLIAENLTLEIRRFIMDLSDFAERILFGDTLEDKLLSPVDMVDEKRSILTCVPDLPGRPQALLLEADAPRHKSGFPGLGALESERTRGHVLHFFANHELLALELMALMLLRFPDAPLSFRAGMYRTMLEEQGHLRMYKQEMERARVEFGEIPVNAFFWRVLRDMRSPLDFVTGMSMTFEQANLDYSGYYARAFRQIGDTQTADVLDIVYDEEIGHVKHGVIWFDRWRPKDEPRFKAYEILLPEGISPIRAKGKDFDMQARQRAGLDDDFIAHLKLYRASRGRPPRLLWFNGGVEHEYLANADKRPKAVDAMIADMELLMAPIAAQEDILVTHAPVSRDTRAYLDRVGLPLPAIVTLDASIPLTEQIEARHLGGFMPWGVSEASSAVFAPLADRLVDSGREQWELWHQGTRLYHKLEMHTWRTHALAACCQEQPAARGQRVIDSEDCGCVVVRIEDIESMLASRPGQRWVLKSAWSASGRSSIRLWDDSITVTQRGWIQKTLRRDGGLLMEPWRDRVVDVSWQMDVESDETVHHGLQRFIADARGQYRGAFLHRMTDGMASDLVRWIHDDGRHAHWIRTVQQDVADRIADTLRTMGYRGPVGIDAMVYRNGSTFAFHPVVEVNTRFTMGRVAHELSKRVSRRCSAAMLVVPVASLQERHGSVTAARQWVDEHAAVQTTGAGPETQIVSGVVWLSDMARAKHHVPVLCVASDWESLSRMAEEFAALSIDPMNMNGI